MNAIPSVHAEVSVSAAHVPWTSELWQEMAQADYRLCREFARRHNARLNRSLRCQRVGWELYGFSRYALLLPDSLPPSPDDEWYCYYPAGESLFRRTRKEREQQQMLVLAESCEDWAELLRQALGDQALDARFEITSIYINAFGDLQSTPTGFRFELVTCPPPHATGGLRLQIAGTGATPEGAARAACARWMGMNED